LVIQSSIILKTLAIVVGNNDYQETAKLVNAVNDAKAIADVFRRLEYEVILRLNLDSEGCILLLDELAERIREFDATIFFFAGHGFELDGENFLTSVECQIPPGSRHLCSRNSISFSELLKIYKEHPDKSNIIIVDACRKAFSRGTETTFAPVLAPKGTLIAFSTSPQEGSGDGKIEDGNSVYTRALLSYIGREHISVEELFKKVRRTVNHWTKGAQTPWEHTSLIGDFYFNTGQLAYSRDIPYNEEVVKDIKYKTKGDQFSNMILEVRSLSWDRQNPALVWLLDLNPREIDKNQQFILGRNLLQASGYAREAIKFFRDLQTNLRPYSLDGQNHVFNGILFEVYFNKSGEFRMQQFKTHCFNEILSLRKNQVFSNSFKFIADQILQFRDRRPFWVPSSADTIVDVDVRVSSETLVDWMGEIDIYDVLISVVAMGIDITSNIRTYNIEDGGLDELKKAIAGFLAAPVELIDIHNNTPINKIGFRPLQSEVDDQGI